MTRAQFTDRMVTDGHMRKTDDGWAVQARVARGGNVQVYLGDELGKPEMKEIRVYRPADEVFDRKAIETYARKPITLGHPRDNVTPETWKDLAVGEIDRDVMRDGDFVSVPLLFRDQRAVDAINAFGGPKELSMGYDAMIRFEDGQTPSGEEYDAVMSDFRMNHVAVVGEARGGAELRIGDGANGGKTVEQWGAAPITTSDTKEVRDMTDALVSVVLGDKAVQVPAKDAPAIEAFKAEMTKKLADQKADHDKEIAAKDAEIAKKDQKIADTEAKVLSDADLDKRVAARAKLVGDAAKVAKDVKTEGLTDADIRKAVVSAKLGDTAVADKSDAYIEARFDGLVEAADAGTPDPVKTILADGTKPAGDALGNAYDDHRKSLADAWKGTPAKKEA